jgi:mRNA-degrading endonuclease YafQ of YafQ-DinJ toxin-antitoxin module
MKQVILLATDWDPNYWESNKEAPYPKRKYTELPGWEELSKNCPLAGLGIYSKLKKNDLTKIPFVYLKIIGMRYESNTHEPHFNFELIKKSKTESKRLIDRLPEENKKLFSAIEAGQLIKILYEIGEEPPKEWFELIELVRTPVSWEEYIGKYFLKLKDVNISNSEFEDIVAKLLNALGFDITQKGHKIEGEFADGIAAFENDYAIVYDCKNIYDYIPTANDKRALEKYFNDERKVRKEKYLYKAFIAKSFGEAQRDIFYLSVDSLLYLLYKKLTMGSKFTLLPFKKILDNNIMLTIKIINKEWLVP